MTDDVTSEPYGGRDGDGLAFLLRLADAMAALADPAAVTEVSERLLGEHLRAERCCYAELDTAETATREGPETAVRDEIADGFVLVPLVERGAAVARMEVTAAGSRRWTPQEVELVRQVVRRTRDAVERSRAEAALRDSEARHRALFEQMDEAYAVVEIAFGPDGRRTDVRFVQANPAFVAHTGLPWPVGKTATELLGAPGSRWADLCGRVAETGEPARVEESELSPGRVFDLNVFRLGGPGSRRVAVLFADVTGRRAAEAALKASEQRFRALATTGGASIYRMSPDWRLMYALDSSNLAAAGEPIEDWADRYILTDDRPMVFEAIRRAIDTRTPFELEHRVALADGSVGWVLSRAVPLFGADGEIVEWFGAGQDVTERRAAVERLTDSEARFRSFAETSVDTLWIYDAEAGRVEYLSPAFERTWGESRERALADVGRWAELVHPDDLGAAANAMPRALNGETVVFEYRIVRPADGAVRWIRDTGFPIAREGGRVVRVGGIAQDVTAQRAAAERQQLLLDELQHRVRNTLGVVRSIARRTAETSQTAEELASHLDGRIEAFARTQAVLTRDPAAGVDLAFLVAEELRAHAAPEGEGVVVEGPSVALQPKAAETLGLAVHELASNAMKYGALSRAGGRLSVRWRIEPGVQPDELVFEWVEAGAPGPVTPPVRRGFGTELLERTLAYELKAATRLEWRPDGLCCAIRLPLGPKVLRSS